MKEILLNGTWTMTQVTHRAERPEFEKIQGTVPGSVVSFLLDSGKIEDPFYRDNELKTLELFEEDYTFSRDFEIAEKDLESEHQVLRFNGVDTLAEIYLNDVRIGETYNMHRYYEFDVRGILLPEHNHLEVRIKSPLKYIREKDAKYHLGGSYEAMRGFPHLRKAHCMFGWDWGPRIPDEGIFRDVRLLLWDGSGIEDIVIHQDHIIPTVDAQQKDHQVSLTVEVKGVDAERLRITLCSPDGSQSWYLQNGQKFDIPQPQLWWPSGLGEQPLYTVTVEHIGDDGTVLERIGKRIGLRKLTVRRRKDEWGESFAQEVNGRTFFAMGGNYIPEDSVLSRRSRERTEKLLRAATESGFNSIRVWGGGFYPDDWFYDLCDELGLIVWQDLMFACAYYKTDEELDADGVRGEIFEENISEEIAQNLRRIRHHACIGIVGGNNEMESFAASGGYECTNETRKYYLYQNEILIPKIMKREAPDIFYWPSSPSSGGSFDDPQNENRGDVHFWSVWHSNVPFTDYRSHFFRYLSEFGFQSFPDMETIRSFTEPEDRNIFSYVMEMHQRNAGANGKILNYLAQNYLYPSDFEKLVYASQLLQADAIRYGVEHLRRNRNSDRCMGAIYWQFNDIWPVASWSSCDYFGRWKALQYAAKRFFSPVMISCEETSLMSEEKTCIADPSLPHTKPSAKLCVTNETWDAAEGTVVWSVRNEKGDIVRGGEEKITVEPFSSLWLPELDLPDIDIYREHLAYSFVAGDGSTVSSGTTLFCPPKHYGFENPDLQLSLSGGEDSAEESAEGDMEVTVRATAFARYVEIYSAGGYVRTSDNFFDMEKGEKTVKIIEGDVSDLRVRSVYDIG